MSTASRTASPLTLCNYGDTVQVAIAIQESIELIVRGHYDPSASEPKFDSRSMGNIKVAFPNAFARGNYSGKSNATLKLRLHSTENIIRYYASILIKDLDLGTNSLVESPLSSSSSSTTITTDAFSYSPSSNTQINEQGHLANNDNCNKSISTNGKTPPTTNNHNNNHNLQKQSNLLLLESLDYDNIDEQVETANNSQHNIKQRQQTQTPNSRIIEFDMEALTAQLRKMYDQSPTSRYYNVDVLRYRIEPIKSIEESPLQVCAYWKVEAQMVKLRIDFKHSIKSGINLERLREIVFTVSLAEFIPTYVDVDSSSPDSMSTLSVNNNNNNNLGAMNMNSFESLSSANTGNHAAQIGRPQTLVGIHGLSTMGQSIGQPHRQPPSSQSSSSMVIPTAIATNVHLSDAFETLLNPTTFNIIPQAHGLGQNNLPQSVERFANVSSNQKTVSSPSQQCISTAAPIITHKPQAHWNNSIKQLSWKFDTLLSYHKTDGLGSLFAKLDFRNHPGMSCQFLGNCKPTPVDIKFLVSDSTLSKLSMSIDTNGYKMSLLKREIRSGKFQSEPYIM